MSSMPPSLTPAPLHRPLEAFLTGSLGVLVWLACQDPQDVSPSARLELPEPPPGSPAILVGAGAIADCSALQPVLLYNAGADVVIGGHDPHYERFAPHTPHGVVDSAHGIRQFMVGTGGANPRDVETAIPNSEKHDNKTLGVLALTLADSSYGWEFVPVEGSIFRDSGSAACHGPP